MSNFRRALSTALRYRWMLVGIFCSSLGVAIFWGANLGTVYPIVDVVLKDRSLHEWVDENIATAKSSLEESRQERKLLEQRDGDPDNSSKLNRLLSRESADAKALGRAQALKPWIQRYTPTEPFPTLLLVVSFLLFGSVMKSISIIINVLLVEKSALLVGFRHRNLLFRRTMEQDMARINNEHTSELVARFTHDVECLTAGVRTVLGRAIREPLKILACLIGAGMICWRLLFFSLVVMPFAVYLVDRLAKSVKRASRRALDEMSQLYKRLSESLAGIELVKAFTTERFERRRFHLVAKEYMRKAHRIALYRALNKPINELVSVAILACALLTGGYLVLNQESYLFGFIKMTDRPLNFGSLMTFFALVAGISDPFRKLSDLYNEIQRAVAASDRIYRVIDRTSEIADPPVAKPLSALKSLRFENVHFSYDATTPVLNAIDLEIRRGETIAIVGPNGCGKSTFAKLIPRFYDPKNGSVQWNGINLRDAKLRDLRGRIGLVTQRTLLFNDTVYNNIRYGSPYADRAQVIEAARRAHADEFIQNQLQNGYDTMVGEGGCSLSGGQRQRIAMARALLCDPELLILDEATSQIDLESERLIGESLAEFTKDRTAVVVTHRLETLSICDRVVLMNAGKILMCGAHDELMSDCPDYRRLHRKQWSIPA